MAISVYVSGISREAFGTEVDVSYTCPHCGESVSETLCFEKGIKNCIACVDAHDCPECGESNDLEVDLY